MEEILEKFDQHLNEQAILTAKQSPLLDGEVDLPHFQNLFTKDMDANFAMFSQIYGALKKSGKLHYHRRLLSPIDRKVKVWDEASSQVKEMLMFGSNNYLGMANDPIVKLKVKSMIDEFGVGIAGPMLLNGTSDLHHLVQQKLAHLKSKEDCILIPTGYMTNLTWISSLLTDEAVLFYDEVSHASVSDGIRLGRKKAFRFNHSDCNDLEIQLKKMRDKDKNKRPLFVSVQGVYSMNGELAPLPDIVELCEKYDAELVVDDAHGTGVMGKGRGTAEHFGISNRLRYSMGTLSKAFSVTGGFFVGDFNSIHYLRFFSRPYFFSASLSPMIMASILASLEIIESQQERIEKLHSNANRFRMHLKNMGAQFYETESAIIPVFPPTPQRFREIAAEVHARGLFLNSIEAPGVPRGRERFRITVMSSHTNEDIDQACMILKDVFEKYS